MVDHHGRRRGAHHQANDRGRVQPSQVHPAKILTEDSPWPTISAKAQLRFTKEQFKATNPTPAADVLCVETDSNVYTPPATGHRRTCPFGGTPTLSGDDRRSADDVYAGQTLGVWSGLK
jgi:hypothetical protein